MHFYKLFDVSYINKLKENPLHLSTNFFSEVIRKITHDAQWNYPYYQL